MNENQRKWLQELDSKGIKFESYIDDEDRWVSRLILDFESGCKDFRLPAQPIPDIPDWREVCRDMQSKGIMIEHFGLFSQSWSISNKTMIEIHNDKTLFRIPAQPIPAWVRETIREKLSNLKPVDEEHFKQIKELDKIPHRDLQIQWHEDCIHALKTGEPMREWEFIDKYYKDWQLLSNTPSWSADLKYRRKPRINKVQLWCCLGQLISNPIEFLVFGSLVSRDDLVCRCESKGYRVMGAIVQNQVEIPDHD